MQPCDLVQAYFLTLGLHFFNKKLWGGRCGAGLLWSFLIFPVVPTPFIPEVDSGTCYKRSSK